MSFSSLQWFQLVWWTALALYYGHRISIDLDLFSSEYFDEQAMQIALLKELEVHGMSIKIVNIAPHTINAYIDGIKVDILTHHYPIIWENYCENGMTLSSLADIWAMKLSAAAGRGSKKDFFDIYELLQHFSFEELLWFYNLKYTQIDSYHVIRALTYFDDAELQEDPTMLTNTTRDDVKWYISDQIASYMEKII